MVEEALGVGFMDQVQEEAEVDMGLEEEGFRWGLWQQGLEQV